MYCSSCGSALTPGLSYCNRCGDKLEVKQRSINKAAELRPEFLVAAIVAVTGIGLGAIITLLSLLKQAAQFAGVIMGFSMLFLLLVLATDGLFLWLLLRTKKLTTADDEPARLKERTTRELDAGRMHELPEPALSVTDHTTRTLDPIPTGRKAG